MEAVQERMFIFEWRQTQEFSYRKFLQSNPQKSRESFSMRREAQTLLAKRILFINDKGYTIFFSSNTLFLQTTRILTALSSV